MTTLRRCIEFLDRNAVHYVHTRHANAYRARELARAEHVPPSAVAKSVVFCADKSYGIALMPADRALDLEELAEHLGVSKIRLATESEVVKLAPDSEVGAIPPFGCAIQYASLHGSASWVGEIHRVQRRHPPRRASYATRGLSARGGPR